MPTISDQTVREIAVSNAGSTRVFEKLGIDYCCGGNRSLSVACELANVPLGTVLTMLDQCTEPITQGVSNDAPLGEIAGYIVERHHGYIRQESPRIQGLLDKVCGKHDGAHAELSGLKELFGTLTRELTEHLMKEERILFPYIQALSSAAPPAACFAQIESPIEVMLAEHENAGSILLTMRTLSGGYKAPAGACTTYQALYRALEEFERDLHRHIHLENNILFPRAIAADRDRRNALAAANKIPQ